MAKHRPLFDDILVREQDQAAGKLVLPDGVQINPFKEGVVERAGPGNWDGGIKIPMMVKVGDRVMFSHHGAAEIEPGLYLLKQTSVAVVIEDE